MSNAIKVISLDMKFGKEQIQLSRYEKCKKKYGWGFLISYYSVLISISNFIYFFYYPIALIHNSHYYMALMFLVPDASKFFSNFSWGITFTIL